MKVDAALTHRLYLRASVVLCVLGFALRLWRLGESELWLDEANSLFIARGTYLPLFEALRVDSSPPLYYLILRGWTELFGVGEFAVRLPSVLAGAGLLASLAYFGPSLVGRGASLAALGFLAINAGAVDYAQQARQYTLGALAVFLAFVALVRWNKTQRWSPALGFAAATTSCLLLHNFCLYLLPTFGVLRLAYGRPAGTSIAQALRNKRYTGQALAVAVIVLGAYLPWLGVLLVQLERSEYLFWVQDLWVHLGWLKVVMASLDAFLYGPPWTRQHPYVSWEAVPALIVGITILTTCLLGTERNASVDEATPPAFWVWGWVVPILLALGVSISATYPNFIPGRVDQLLLPVFAISLGLTLVRLGGLARPLIAVVVVGGAVMGLSHLFSAAPAKAGARQAAAVLEEQAEDGDVVLFIGLTRAPVETYLRRRQHGEEALRPGQGHRLQLASLPRLQEQHLGNIARNYWRDNPEALEQEVAAVVAGVLDELPPGRRLFVVAPDEARSPFLGPVFVTLRSVEGLVGIGYRGRFKLNRFGGVQIFSWALEAPMEARRGGD
jgi:4-amino-4-deoxy-L-arabinose transferase-like glycosyltransferase